MTPSPAPRYPEAVAALSARDGNAFNVLAVASRALAAAGVPRETIRLYLDEAQSGDYDHLLTTTMRWMTVR